MLKNLAVALILAQFASFAAAQADEEEASEGAQAEDEVKAPEPEAIRPPAQADSGGAGLQMRGRRETNRPNTDFSSTGSGGSASGVGQAVEGARNAGRAPGGRDCSQAAARAADIKKQLALARIASHDLETEWQLRRALAHHAISRYLYENPSACAYQEALAAHEEAEEAWHRYTNSTRSALPGHAPICPPGKVPKEKNWWRNHKKYKGGHCRGAY
ncbi:MAG: hypothetical protein HYV14_14875 [Elusimicrobia bacterium]|nr:hypothetical protein [Elusimicrobiota bacterium]